MEYSGSNYFTIKTCVDQEVSAGIWIKARLLYSVFGKRDSDQRAKSCTILPTHDLSRNMYTFLCF